MWLGEIDCETVAGAAVEALARGVGLSIRITVEGRIRQRLLEDLHALGEVIPPGRPGQQLALDDDQRALIEALVSGTTLTQAASDLNWSRRTANRRMAEVRAALEADTTAEAITAWATRRRTC